MAVLGLGVWPPCVAALWGDLWGPARRSEAGVHGCARPECVAALCGRPVGWHVGPSQAVRGWRPWLCAAWCVAALWGHPGVWPPYGAALWGGLWGPEAGIHMCIMDDGLLRHFPTRSMTRPSLAVQYRSE